MLARCVARPSRPCAPQATYNRPVSRPSVMQSRPYSTKKLHYFNDFIPPSGVPDKMPDLTPIDIRNHPKRIRANVARGLERLIRENPWSHFKVVYNKTGADRRAENVEKTRKIPAPEDLTEPRGDMTVPKFLTTIGRGCDEYIEKIPDWKSLFNWKSEKLKEVGVPTRQRKWILHWVERYRQGFDPYYISLRSHSARNKPSKLTWRAKLIEKSHAKKAVA